MCTTLKQVTVFVKDGGLFDRDLWVVLPNHNFIFILFDMQPPLIFFFYAN